VATEADRRRRERATNKPDKILAAKKWEWGVGDREWGMRSQIALSQTDFPLPIPYSRSPFPFFLRGI
jgi:hypothetical protein